MKGTLVSGLLLATVAGCIVVNPKAPTDDRAILSRQATTGSATGWQPPTGLTGTAVRPGSQLGATMPPGPVASQPPAPSTTESAFTHGVPGALPGMTPLAMNNQPAPAGPAAGKPFAGLGNGPNPPDSAVLPASYSEVRSDPSGLSATTLPPQNGAPPALLPAGLTSEHPQEPAPVTVASAPAVRMVNSKRFTLNYEIKDAGNGTLSAVDLWCTQDMRQWKKFDAVPQGAHAYLVEVKDEGTFGFTLVARGGADGARPPQAGDAPQVWVMVDATKPAVQLTGLELSLTTKIPSLIVRWSATDKNFGPRPVTLSYASKPEGPWTLLAENLENTGRYEWPIPANLPPAMYVRVEAMDLVGNSSMVQTPTPIHLDANWMSAFGPPEAGKTQPLPHPSPEQAKPVASIVNLEVSPTQTAAASKDD
jgi:hypothetical protein